MRIFSLIGFAFALGAILSPIAALAQPTLNASVDGRSKTIRLHTLSIDIKATGQMAVTTLDMTFYNELDRILEGNLEFPLGEGQTVSRFAMEMEGHLREGVVVEKEKGQQAFETVVRRRIDPGLLERVAGNTFRARVYPIPAKGYKRILVAFEQELKATPDGFLYLLPMGYKAPIDTFSVDATVLRQDAPPLIPDNTLANFRFEQWQSQWKAHFGATDYLPGPQLGILLPHASAITPGILVPQALVGKGPDGKLYFSAHLQPKPQALTRTLPKKVCVLWDVSGSAQHRNLAKELALLDAWFAKLSNVELTVVPFSISPGFPLSGYVVEGRWAAVRQQLLSLPFDGATQLGSLNLNDYPADEYILFSDGISNYGTANPRRAGKPVYAVSSSPSAEHVLLRQLAERTGGRYLPLSTMTQEEALSALASVPYRLVRMETGQGVQDVQTPTDFVENGISISGKATRGNSFLIAHFGDGTRILESIRLEIGAPQDDGGMAARTWARMKLARLEASPKENAEAITTLGKQFSIVTPRTSLIVLETVEDYVRFEIPAPKELRAEYDSLIALQTSEKAYNDSIHMAMVREAWEVRKKDWNELATGSKRRRISSDSLVTDGGEDWADEAVSIDFVEPMMAEEAPPPPPPTAEPEYGTVGEVGAADDEGMFDLVKEDAISNHTTTGSYTVTVTDANAATVDGGITNLPSHRGVRTGSVNLDSEELESTNASGGTQIQAWNPDEPYMPILKAAKPQELYATYITLKDSFGDAPAFYLDCADHFFSLNRKAEGMRILSNIAEMQLENYRLLRVMAHRLLQLGETTPAVIAFRQVKELRPEEPHSLRDLADAEARNGNPGAAAALLWEVVTSTWDDRFSEIEQIALVELNALAAKHGPAILPKGIPKTFLYNMPQDMRVVLNWDADNSDIDLWVTDPAFERCYYSNPATALGGRLSRDMTGGYGPEEFRIRKAKHGEYMIETNYYSDSQQSLTGATTIQVQIFRNYGRPNQTLEEVTMRLKTTQEELLIGTVKF